MRPPAGGYPGPTHTALRDDYDVSRLGDCYANAYGEAIQILALRCGLEDHFLVHGTIQTGIFHAINHAWVLQPNGVVYEPTADARYTRADFERLYNPTAHASYTPDQAMKSILQYDHFGPWDWWSSVYFAEVLDHLDGSMASMIDPARVEAEVANLTKEVI